MYYNNSIEPTSSKSSIKKALKFAFSGFSLFIVGMLFFVVVYHALTGATSETTAEYCKSLDF
jgi:hypothetical protein